MHFSGFMKKAKVLSDIIFSYILPIKVCVLVSISFCIFGCSLFNKNINVNTAGKMYKIGDIIDVDMGEIITLDCMITNLAKVSIVYVGEQHSNFYHHQKQLEIIDALLKGNSQLSVGMEMFDYTYQDVLSTWSEGLLTKTEFLRASHWYSNWRFSYDLYEDILDYVKNNKLRIIGLNIPFHIPSKIATGGIGNLCDEDKQHLPRRIDLTCVAHKKYIEKIYENHCVLGREDFDSFYEAQCVWEDSMAQNILKNLTDGIIVVLVGNGHIINKFGIPDRVQAMSKVSFKTIYLANIGDEIDYSFADYIIFTNTAGSNLIKIRGRDS